MFRRIVAGASPALRLVWTLSGPYEAVSPTFNSVSLPGAIRSALAEPARVTTASPPCTAKPITPRSTTQTPVPGSVWGGMCEPGA